MLAAMPGQLGTTPELEWREADVSPIGVVDLAGALGPANYADAYAATVLALERPTRVRFDVRSDDGIAMWLNGRLVHDARGWRALDEALDRFEVTVPRGRHLLFCRIRQGEGDWAFQVQPWDLTFHPPRPLSATFEQ